MTVYEFLTLLTSLLAIVVSLVSLVRTRKIAQEQLDLERITADLSRAQLRNLEEENKEKEQPNLNVTIQRLGKASYFYITNSGQGTAYGLDLELIDCERSPLSSDVRKLLPLAEMKPKSRIKLPASFVLASPLKYEVLLTWFNQQGEIETERFWVTK